MDAGDAEASGFQRVIAHLDLDCFFVQVEIQKNPLLRNKPVAVQQHQDIISVSYEARARGVLKHMTPKEAVDTCPEVALVHVKKRSGTTKVSYEDYQSAHDKVWKILTRRINTEVVEKASIDDFYLDLTNVVAEKIVALEQYSQSTQQGSPENGETETIIYGEDKGLPTVADKQLMVAAQIVSNIRNSIFKELGFTASAGISHNKLLARMASGLNKPNKQTLLKRSAVSILLSSYPFDKIPRLGVRLGKDKRKLLLEKLKGKAKYVRDIREATTREELGFWIGEEKAAWLWNVTQGIDTEPVQNKGPPKSLMCSMSLTPISNNELELRNVLRYLASELAGRMERDEAENCRQPSRFLFNFRLVEEKEISQSLPFTRLQGKIMSIRKERKLNQSEAMDDRALTISALVGICLELFKSSVGDRSWSLRWIGMIVNNFIALPPVGGSIEHFFSMGKKAEKVRRDEEKDTIEKENEKEREKEKEKEKEKEEERTTNKQEQQEKNEVAKRKRDETEKTNTHTPKRKKKEPPPVQKNTMLAYLNKTKPNNNG